MGESGEKMHMTPPRVWKKKMHLVPLLNLKSVAINQIAKRNLAQIIKPKVSPKVGQDSISKFKWESLEKQCT